MPAKYVAVLLDDIKFGCHAGWTPSTFRSSRGSKAEFSGQKPEDFMDAEVRVQLAEVFH